jgi:uncharacterized protein YkwD
MTLFNVGATKLKTTFVLVLSLSLLFGCSAPEKHTIVIYKNKFFKCEPSGIIKKKMVTLINNARSFKRKCGFKTFNPAGPVKWNSTLVKAALNHSRDMAEHDFLSHTGSKGSSADERVKKVGYAWKSVGENISAGSETCEEVVAGWLNSPGHCKNIMNSNFTEIGAACFRNPSSKYGTYWTLVLASPL